MSDGVTDGNVIPLRAGAQRHRSARSRSRAQSQSQSPTSRPTGSWERRIAAGLGFARRRLEGSYRVDDFGFDVELAEQLALPALRLVYERYFRVEVNGVENIPATGPAVLVANHAGGLAPWDAAMTAVAVRLERERYLRPLAADLLFRTPVAGTLARRAGATTASPDDAARLLAAGELVGVWPEGFAGTGKSYHDRYQLQRFGRGGFARAALSVGAPIVPVSIVGSEETHPVLGTIAPLALLLDLPYFPITPTFPLLGPLGLVPLPSKWYLEFGEPIRTDQLAGSPEHASDDPAVVFDLVDRTREQIQTTLYRLLAHRRSAWR